MTAATAAAGPPEVRPRDFLGIDHLLTVEERDMPDTMRAFVTNRVRANLGNWFEARIPRELAPSRGRRRANQQRAG